VRMGARHGRIDCSADTYIAVCEVCPGRVVGAAHTLKASALADLEAHRRRVHPQQARDAAKKQRRRHLVEV
jgi:hypothetical protein